MLDLDNYGQIGGVCCIWLFFKGAAGTQKVQNTKKIVCGVHCVVM